MDRYSCGVALTGRLGQAYDEEAFQYFLAIERNRSGRSGRPFLLLLVDLTQAPGVSERFDPLVGVKLFSVLWLCLRETDFIGWYRQERVAGAVLTLFADECRTEVSRLIRQRVSEMLCDRFDVSVTSRLRVHVQLQPNLISGSSRRS